MVFSVTLVPENVTNDISFKWAVAKGSNDTADSPADFTASTDNPGTIDSGETSTIISVPIIGDLISEENETFTVTLSDPASADSNETVTFFPNSESAQGTIIDNDDPVLSFQEIAVSAAEGAEGADVATNIMTFTVTADPVPTAEIMVDWATSVIANVDTATAGSDYTEANGTLTFGVGVIEQSFTVVIIGDDTPEPDEAFTVTLSNVRGGRAVLSDTANVAKGTITNDDGSLLTIAGMRIDEGDQGENPKMIFTVSAEPVPTTALTANWVTSIADDDTATAGVDFTMVTDGVVTIASNEATGTFEVEIIGDGTPEYDETFTVTLSGGSEGTLITANRVQRKVQLLMMMALD